MSLRKFLDSDVEILIELRKNERALWDVTFPKYSNVDVRTQVLTYTHIHYTRRYVPTYVCTYIRRYYVVSTHYACM